MNQVLVIARNALTRDQLVDVARGSGLTVESREDFAPACDVIEKEPPALVVAEEFPDESSREKVFKALKQHAPVTPLIMYIAEPDGQRALKWMSQGAYDCICPPLSPGDFLAAGKRAVQRHGRRLLTKKTVKPMVWWKQPIVHLSAGMLALLVLIGAAMAQLWAPPFQIYKLGSSHAISVAGSEDSLWVADWLQQGVSNLKVQGDYLSIIQRYHLEDFQPVAVVVAPYYLYTASADGRLRRHRRDETLSVVASQLAPGASPSGLAWDGLHLWSTDSYTKKIYQHDSRLGVQQEMDAPGSRPMGLAWHKDHLWVADGNEKSLWKLSESGAKWERSGPYGLEIFLHDEDLKMSGFTIWKNKVWIVSEGRGVLVQHRLPKGD